MSIDEFVTSSIRSELADNLRARRRAYRELRKDFAGDGLTLGRISMEWEKEEFAVASFLHGYENRIGLPILSTTRKQMRMEGKHVN